MLVQHQEYNVYQAALSYFLFACGVFYFGYTMLDMLYCDVFGFDHMRYFQREGSQVPVPFTMKNLSRIALSCRNSLMTGLLLIHIGPLVYPAPISLGRILFTAQFITGILMGTYFEQRELKNTLGHKAYSHYQSIIPNALIPDFSVLFVKSEAEIEEMRKGIRAMDEMTEETTDSGKK